MTDAGEVAVDLGRGIDAGPVVDPDRRIGAGAVVDPERGMDALWSRFRRGGERAARDELILRYTPLVSVVAARVSTRLSLAVEHADLASYGMFGLIDAIGKFDPGRGVSFERYAIARIRGAMIDGLRTIDWVPRSVRAKARAVAGATARLEGTLRRAPTEAELARELDVSDRDLRQLLKDVSSLRVLPLDAVVGSGDESGESTTLAQAVGERYGRVAAEFEAAETKLTLASAMSRLGPRERLVLELHYYESRTLAEIGGLLGVTESRACQLHTKAVCQLRSRLQRSELVSA